MIMIMIKLAHNKYNFFLIIKFKKTAEKNGVNVITIKIIVDFSDDHIDG